jgi:environmental stress-induced protein Ves
MATTNTFRGAPEQARQRRQAAGRAALRGTPAPDDDVQWFDLRSVPAMPWKNGGGSTRELACWPPGADITGFDWRVSVASIAAAGPFSVFAGVDRHIMLLDGDGVHLAQPVDDSAAQASGATTGSIAHSLHQRWQPFAFAGDVPIDCAMLGGPSTDFNLMLRRGRCHGDVQVLREACAAGPEGAGLCMVLQGQWAVLGGERSYVLGAGQGLWWPGPLAARSLEPLVAIGHAHTAASPFAPDARPALVRVTVREAVFG